MEAKVLKPIPGVGYSIGETADFEESTSQWLIEGKYIEAVETKNGKPEKKDKENEKPETATNKAVENAAKPNNK